MLKTKITIVILSLLFLPAVVFADNWDSMVWDEDCWSILEIKANGQTGNVTISHLDNLLVTVQLNPDTFVGTKVDWWVIVCANGSWFYMDSVAGWTQGGAWRPILQGPLFNLPPTEVLNINGLATGLYTFYFVVDCPMNGILNEEQILADSVTVNVR